MKMHLIFCFLFVVCVSCTKKVEPVERAETPMWEQSVEEQLRDLRYKSAMSNSSTVIRLGVIEKNQHQMIEMIRSQQKCIDELER